MSQSISAQEFYLMLQDRAQIQDEHQFSEEKPQMEEPIITQKMQIDTSSPGFRLGALIVALLAFVALFGYAVHERNLAQQLTGDNQQTVAALKDTHSQIDALNAKLDGIINARQPVASREQVHVAHAHAVAHHAKPDPRFAKLQSQLDSQGKAIDATRQGLASTQQDLSSTRTELSGSIARTHDELVVLQRKGERNYYEFDLDKSKQFSHAGPVGISLRKANTKHQYADLELLVDDRDVSKKHLNLYEPAMFYPDAEHQPLELVINSINKNHIHGYISAPKYSASELTAMSNNPEQQPTTSAAANPTSQPQLRRR
jgi:hypothetical protein